MSVEFIYPEFKVIRNADRCIACCVCERQCANEVHTFNEEKDIMMSDETKCVNCQRCVSLCPTRALKILKSGCTLQENANWQNDSIKEIYKQANSGGVQRLRDEGIRNNISLVVGADACYIATAALLALGCHLCPTCQSGKCNRGIATQRPELVKRLNPDMGCECLINLVNAWRHEIKELGGM